MPAPPPPGPLDRFHHAVRAWFTASFDAATAAQSLGWPPICDGKSTLLLAPTGSGKTLAAFLAALDRVMFEPEPPKKQRCRVLYISPLKALGVDVERNLRLPIAGIAETATRLGVDHRVPLVGVRSGDTPASVRAKMGRSPPDILITTPESLYLLLTSEAREILAPVDTVIIDEIHSVAATKRGAHLFLSLERVEMLRANRARPLQRIGLSATQRPLAEIARLLGGSEISPAGVATARPVEIVHAGTKKAWDIVVEVPAEDMAKLGAQMPAGRGKKKPIPASIWPTIHPRLVELIRAHRSTMIFANSRRLAERLASAINETAGEELALAHHGSLARATREDVEDRLKKGDLRAIVATSSLELGLDLGAVDLVIQIEAPPSIASGLQRIGRAGHSVGAISRGVVFPKYRGDLLACAAATERMVKGEVEETFYLRNPLDVLAQQIVAIVAMDTLRTDDLFDLVRRAAPYADLPRGSFENVLDMLSGRYPSDEFADLRPRITWDRVEGTVRARDSAKRIAVVNGGTIPDRGFYGVYLFADSGEASRRVGELDEEMVFETHPGEVFLLGASSWRVVEITHDRVLVTPAPGEPGKMPFWHGDRPGRPAELGRAIGKLARTLAAMTDSEALKRLTTQHNLDARAATNLLAYVREQKQATGEIPSDKTIVVERYLDEVGSLCVCLLSPFGARVHAPWSTAVLARLHAAGIGSAEGIWSDDGVVFRLPESDQPPDIALFLPPPDEVEDLLVKNLGATSLFAARFRENAGRALLLPRKRPGQRSPLWATRKRSADLLEIVARYPSFPLLLETYRECLRDVFDMPALVEILRQIAARKIRIVTVDSRTPSPFAASLMFSYVASFIYDGDTPLAERRAQALTVDSAQLRELLGEAELRELLDAEAIEEMERTLQRLDPKRPLATADHLHDLLLAVGDLTTEEIAARSVDAPTAQKLIATLEREHRVFRFTLRGAGDVVRGVGGARGRASDGAGDVVGGVGGARGCASHGASDVVGGVGGARGRASHGAGDVVGSVDAADDFVGDAAPTTRAAPDTVGGLSPEVHIAAAEDAARFRDALGIPLPRTLPPAFLAPVADPLGDLVSRFARTHGPFLADDVALRFALGIAPVLTALRALVDAGRILEGEFLPGGRSREYCDADVLRSIKRRSLAKLRREVEPVETPVLGRFLTDWQGLARPRPGAEALLAAVELLQGAPLPASALEADILPARVERYRSGDLDLLCAAGEIVWVGLEPLGPHDGRIALYPTAQLPLLAPPAREVTHPLAPRIRDLLARRGALFFTDLADEAAAFPADLFAALWELVWAGEVTNDTFAPLRSLQSPATESKRATLSRSNLARSSLARSSFNRPRRVGPPGSEGRWSLLPTSPARRAIEGAFARPAPSETERRTALTRALLERHGVLTREAVHAEGIVGGFTAVYDVLKAMEDAGRVRRGYFVAGLGATQFAVPGAEDRLRSHRDPSPDPRALLLAATDPANPYGAALPWPEREGQSSPAREGASTPLEGSSPKLETARSSRDGARPQRATGAYVVLIDGALIGFIGRAERSLLTFLPPNEPERGHAARALAGALAAIVDSGRRTTLLFAQIDGDPPEKSPLLPALTEALFVVTSKGLFRRGKTRARM